MIITYPISDNFGNEYLIRIEDCQNLPDEIMKELGNIKILDITLERISGEQYTNSGILSKISTFIAGVLLDNENAMLYFYCDDVHDVKRRNMKITPQKFRSDLFSAMFIRYVKAKSLKDIVDTTITVIVKTCSDSLFSIGQKNCQLFVAKLRNFLDSHNRMVLY